MVDQAEPEFKGVSLPTRGHPFFFARCEPTALSPQYGFKKGHPCTSGFRVPSYSEGPRKAVDLDIVERQQSLVL